MVVVVGIACAGSTAAGSTAAEPQADGRFTHLGASDGFAGRIFDITQDRQGFLWFAMQTGLRQYDGIRVKTHRHDPDDPRSISDNYARRLLVDSRQELWAGTNSGGLDRWVPEDESFVSLDLDLGGPITGLVEIAPGRLLAVINLTKAFWISTEDETAHPLEGFDGGQCFVVDPKAESLWIFRLRGLARHPLGPLVDAPPADVSAATEPVLDWPSTFAKPNTLFLDCTLAADGTLWGAAYLGGAVRFRPDTGELTVFQHDPDDPATLTGNDSTAVLEDSRGTVWVSGFSGWNRLRPGASTFERYVSHPIHRRTLVNDQIHAIFEDGTGQIWLGTDFGAARFDPFRESFTLYSYDPTRDLSAPAGSIRSFTEDGQGRLWVGTRRHGVARLDREAGETVFYSIQPDRIQPDRIDPDDSRRDGPRPGHTSRGTAWALSYEAPDRLWVGSERGLARLEISTGRWTLIETPEGGLSERIVTLFRDRSGTLWAGGDDGLYRHDPASDTLKPIMQSVGARILALGEDPGEEPREGGGGRLYVGTERGGLSIFDTESGERLGHWPGEHFALDRSSEGVITSFVIQAGDPGPTVWVGTLGAGLMRLGPDGTWSRFGPEHGLPSNTVRTLLAEPDGSLWLSTGIETMRFDPRSGDLRSFQAADGLPSVVHTKAAFQNRQGEFFLGGLDGFVAFFPDSVPLDTAPPRIVPADFRIGNQSVAPRARQPDSPLEQSITLVDTVTLNHAQNDFSIELAAIHFGDPARNRYAYRLDGVDSDWIEVSAERSFARYSGIPAGHHVFRAKAASRDGVWSEEEARIEIHVLPPPWASWWAFSLYGSAFLGLIAWWIHTKTARLKLEKELQEKELKVLRGMLPICASCKKIRDDDGEWESLERYLGSHSDAKLTHGICPQCADEVLADMRRKTGPAPPPA